MTFEFAVTIFGLTILQLPLVLGSESGRILISMAALIPFWLVIAQKVVIAPAISRRSKTAVVIAAQRVRRQWPLILIIAAFAILISVAIVRALFAERIEFRPAVVDLATWNTVMLFGAVVFLIPSRRPVPFVPAIALSLGIFLIVNVLLVVAGYTGVASDAQQLIGRAEMLAGLGIDSERIVFPMASGINAIGLAAGACLVCSMLLATRPNARAATRSLAFLFAAVSIGVILGSDTRSAFVFALVIGGTMAAAPFRWLAVARWLPVTLPLLPFVVIGVGLWLSHADVLFLISRGSQDFATANGRAVIWGSVLGELSHFSTVHIFGFGYLGATASGVVHHFSYLFGKSYDENALTAHNTVLQYTLDIGYIGALLFLVMCGAILSGLARVSVPALQLRARLQIAVLLFLLIAGTTEACATIYEPETFYVLLLALAAGVGLICEQREALTASRPRESGMDSRPVALSVPAHVAPF
ncbi:MAG TPA: O-antigen ligase family protein [Gemmatimonadaceae bacterium]|jgi:hypothetical protein